MDAGHGWKRYKQGCRCEVCREGNTQYARAYRAEHGIKRTQAQVEAERRYEATRKLARRASRLVGQAVRVLNVRSVLLLSAGDD